MSRDFLLGQISKCSYSIACNEIHYPDVRKQGDRGRVEALGGEAAHVERGILKYVDVLKRGIVCM